MPYLLLVEIIENDGPTDIQQLRRESANHQAIALEDTMKAGRTKFQNHKVRQPSFSINLDDTDELFGGSHFKQQKMLKERQKTTTLTDPDGSDGANPSEISIKDAPQTEYADGSIILASSTTATLVGDLDASFKNAPPRPNLLVSEMEEKLSIHPLSPSQKNFQYHRSVLSRRASQGQDEFSERMRTAAVMLAQLAQAGKKDGSKVVVTEKTASNAVTTKTVPVADDIRDKILKEMMMLEEQRQMKMKVEGLSSGVGGSGGEGGGGEVLEDERGLLYVVKKDKDDPSGNYLLLIK